MTRPFTDWLQPNAVINAQGGSYQLIRRLGEPSMEGIVFEARYRHLLRCAVKFIDPATLDKDLLSNEVNLLSLLRHTHLVRITDFGVAHGDQQNIFGSNGHRFYITTEYIPGQSFDKAWKGLAAPDFLAMLHQLLEAVAYMHNSGVLHMDLKPQNVMVDERAKKAVLIDLGFSLVVNLRSFRTALSLNDEDLKGVSDTDDVYPVATQRYVREDRIPQLRKKISRRTLEREWFPDHDLFALAVLIEDSLPHINFSEWKSARIGLEIIVHKIKRREYLSAASVRDDVHKLEPQYLAPLGIRELSHIEGGRVHIALSAHPVYLSDRILTVASHPLCQRLRYIPQLELEYLLYPDAKQSRFSHSLSTYELCREALNTWLADVRFRLELCPQDIEAILLFALLHDIGHYPLSHMFEDFRPPNPSSDDVQSDEDLFAMFVQGGGGTKCGCVVTEALNAKGESLSSLIGRTFHPNTVESILSIAACAHGSGAPKKPVHRILAGLMSSAIDIDKIAYLLSDSRTTGVPFGRAIDVPLFLRSLRMPAYDDMVMLKHADKPYLVIEDKGLSTAEAIVLARYWMLNRVYWHHTNRAITAAYKFVISELIATGGLTFSDYLKQTFWFDERRATEFLSSRFQTLCSGTVNPLSGLESGQRTLYKRFISSSVKIDGDLHKKLLVSNESSIASVVLESLKKIVPGIKRGQVLVDIPRKQRDEIAEEQVVVVSDSDDREQKRRRTLEHASPLSAKFRQEFLNEVKKCRVFIDPAIHAQLDGSGHFDQARADAKNLLKSRLGA